MNSMLNVNINWSISFTLPHSLSVYVTYELPCDGRSIIKKLNLFVS